jgi:hypothetical protein
VDRLCAGEVATSLRSGFFFALCAAWRERLATGYGSYASFVTEESRVDDGSRESEAYEDLSNHQHP